MQPHSLSCSDISQQKIQHFYWSTLTHTYGDIKKNQGSEFPYSSPLVSQITNTQYRLDMMVQNTKPHKHWMSYSVQDAGTFLEEKELQSQWELQRSHV